MASKNLHEKPFDSGTLAKLEIFEAYAEAWIPTFVMSGEKKIYIYDFFAGTGYDKMGQEGSPIRLLQILKKYIGYIFQKGVEVNVFLNEYDKQKFNILCEHCKNYLDRNRAVNRAIKLHLVSNDFEVVFEDQSKNIKSYPSLVLLDQNGTKFLNKKNLLFLESCVKTDFLFFVSASYWWRFGDQEEFQAHLKIDVKSIKQNPYRFIHKSLIDEIKKLLPIGTDLKLYPYSIKKGANIYGIIFGAKHPLAVDKFLRISWNKNESNGEANFDIHHDKPLAQIPLFDDCRKINKVQRFEAEIRKAVLDKRIRSNKEALEFAHDNGHINSHCNHILKLMKNEGLINYSANSPCVSYDSVHKKNKFVTYNILGTVYNHKYSLRFLRRFYSLSHPVRQRLRLLPIFVHSWNHKWNQSSKV